MVRNQPEVTEPAKRRSCWSYGCTTVLIVFIALMLWIDSGFVIWKKCTIPLPDGSGSVVYMARLNKILCAEWDRQVRLETKQIHGRVIRIPVDGGGADPVNVYWYSAKGSMGPYIRLNDPLHEDVIDIKQGTSQPLSYEANGDMTQRYLKSGPGVYIGRVEYPFNHFVSSKESPETKLPKY